MSGLQTLQSRRTQAKTLTFYKIYKDISPAYLKELVPKEVGEQTHRNLRNTQDIRPPKTSKNYFLKSYIPSSIRLWNKLPHNIRSIAKLDTFRINLHKIYCKPQTYKPYLTGSTPGHTHLSRFRMNLSGLNAHRKKFHFTDNSSCPNCNSPKEDIEHFFPYCNAYSAPRRVLFDHLRLLLPNTAEHLTRLDVSKNR